MSDNSVLPPAVRRLVSLEKRFASNLARAIGLATHAHALAKRRENAGMTIRELDDLESDILRASIVFAHAALDDYLRGVGRVLYRDRGGEALAEIPYSGTTSPKLTLQQLWAHRTSSVAEVIEASVDEYMCEKSFNSSTAVGSFLAKLKIDVSRLKDDLADIDQVMKWRHRIAHQADLDHDATQPPAVLYFNDIAQVIVAMSVIERFARGLLLLVVPIGTVDENNVPGVKDLLIKFYGWRLNSTGQLVPPAEIVGISLSKLDISGSSQTPGGSIV